MQTRHVKLTYWINPGLFCFEQTLARKPAHVTNRKVELYGEG